MAENQAIYSHLLLFDIYFVGAAGFEPATSWSQTRRDNRTTLRPVAYKKAVQK